MPKPKELARHGTDAGIDKLRGQMKDASGRSDDYADKIEESARDIADRAERTAEDIGGKIKDKVTEKVKDKLSERVREREAPRSEPDAAERSTESRYSDSPRQHTEHQKDSVKTRERSERPNETDRSPHEVERAPEVKDSRTEVKTRDRGERPAEPDRSPREVKRAPEAKESRAEVKTREAGSEQPSGVSEPVRERSIRTRADANAETIKTKENYIHKEAKESGRNMSADERHVPKQKAPDKPQTDKSSSLHKPEERVSSGKELQAKQPSGTSRAYQGGKELAQKRSSQAMRRPVSDIAQQTGKSTIKTLEKGAVKTAQKGTVKTAQTTVKATSKGVKTAERTAKTTAKATKAAAKTAQKAAQAAAKAAKAAAQAAVKAAKVAAKAIATAVKAIIAAIKGLIAAIAAGGWVAVVIIVAIAVVAVIICSCFGVFTGGGADDTPTITEVVQQLNAEMYEKIDAIQDGNGEIDEASISYNGSSAQAYINNWADIIAVFAVKTTTDKDNPMEVVVMDDTKINMFRRVFWDMVSISYSIEEKEVPIEPEIDEDEDGEPDTTIYRTLKVNVSTKGYREMIDFYGFDAEQVELLEEMMSDGMRQMLIDLSGNESYLNLSADELEYIMSTLPEDIAPERLQVVLTAYRLKGKVRYFWGGKSSAIGWDPRWGVPAVVTSGNSPTTGTIRPMGLDCSGYVVWVFNNAAGTTEALQTVGHGSANQWGHCSPVDWNDALPGDIAWFAVPGSVDVNHVGVVVGYDTDGAILVAHCSSSRNNVVVTRGRDTGFRYVRRPTKYYDFVTKE